MGKKGQIGIMGLGQHTVSNRVLEEGTLNEKVRSEQNLKGNLAKWSSESKRRSKGDDNGMSVGGMSDQRGPCRSLLGLWLLF